MSNYQPTKTSGHASQIGGAVKQNIGSLLGDRSMQAEGASQRAQGDAEVQAAKAQQFTEGAVDAAGGNIKKHIGAMLGDESMRASGASTQAKGEAQKAANRV
ncbi:hypothetical protein HK097_000380 [Rhizophlyctis rosea]|uniref:CsbD-like domain-containing protein n=1 Tax=Rhizophlyctis rosea TaxID=64517 RepID=A0AAD5X3P3_9FUNG|nr:hypothetical protein HK097_000380 [Rhizophlyctis rosea]